jgi:hypothetical protein
MWVSVQSVQFMNFISSEDDEQDRRFQQDRINRADGLVIILLPETWGPLISGSNATGFIFGGGGFERNV